MPIITLQDDDRDYLLTIPYYKRARAKAIDGSRWDPELRCWRYPKSDETYLALIAEFGDQLYGAVPDPPGLPAPPVPELEQLRDSNRELRSQLEDLQNTLRELKTTTRDSADQQHRTTDWKSALAERAAMTSQVRSQNTALQEKSAALAGERDELLSRIRTLESQLCQLQQQHVAVSFSRQLADLAARASGPNEHFVRLVRETDVGSEIAVTLTRELETVLRTMLGADTRTDLFELIKQARDAGRISENAKDHAHSLRKARNIIVHSHADEVATQVRTLVCLFSAALVWRELPSGILGAPNPSPRLASAAAT